MNFPEIPTLDFWHLYYFTDEERAEAEERAKIVDHLRNSITNGAMALMSALGEIAVRETCFMRFGIDVQHVGSYDFDLLVAGKRVEVKSKGTNFFPDPDWEAYVSGANTHQACDFYAFTRVRADHSMAYILGVIEREEFFRLAEHYEDGYTDPINGHVMPKGGYRIALRKLKPLEKIWERYAG